MDDIIIERSIILPESAVRYSFSRSGGKGGQNVNKVSTKVEMHIDLPQLRCTAKVKARILERLSHRTDAAGILTITSQESRSQWQNRQRAIEKLIVLITEAAVQEKYRVATKPTRSSKVRRVEGKKVDSRKKQLRRTPHRSGDE
jgi:ribosome-associated protein